MRKVQWQETGTQAEEARSEAEDVEAIEELLRDCQERARKYEPGGATAVEKNPEFAPGRAGVAEAEDGTDCLGSSQFEDSDAREAGMGRLPVQMRIQAEDGLGSRPQEVGERGEGSQRRGKDSGRQRLMECRPEAELLRISPHRVLDWL